MVSGALPCDRAGALLGGLFSPGTSAVPKGCTSVWFLGAWARMLGVWVPRTRAAASALLKLLHLMQRGGGSWHVSLVLAGPAGTSGLPITVLGCLSCWWWLSHSLSWQGHVILPESSRAVCRSGVISGSSILGGGCGEWCEAVSLGGSETKRQAEMIFFPNVSAVWMVGGTRLSWP